MFDERGATLTRSTIGFQIWMNKDLTVWMLKSGRDFLTGLQLNQETRSTRWWIVVLELPTCRNCSFHSGCNLRKEPCSSESQRGFAACLSALQDKNQGFLLGRRCQESKSTLENKRDVQFTNIELLFVCGLLSTNSFQTLAAKVCKSFRFSCTDSQWGASGATCTEGKCNMVGLWTPPRGMLGWPHGPVDLPGWPLRHPAGCRAGRHAAKPGD